MIGLRDTDYLAVLPRAVWEVTIPVYYLFCFLVSIFRFKIIRIVCSNVFCIWILTDSTYHQTCVKTLLHCWAVFGRSLCGNTCHNVVLLILSNHRCGICQANKIVIACLNIVVVSIPCCQLVEVHICLVSIEMDS